MKPKKLLSFFLAAAMTISLLPTFTITVSAEEYTGTLDEDTGLYYTKYDDHCKITGCAGGTASFSIPETIENLPVTSIEKGAFALNNLYLTSVTISNSVTSIGEGAFYGCSSITSIEIPDSVTSIGSSAFYDCIKLTSITIGNSVTSIEDSAFGNTGYYNDSSKWENGVLYIGNYLIKANSENILDDISIKSGTKLIADDAFYDCSSLESVTIPNTVTNIGRSAFYGCSSITSIEIPDSVTSIGGSAFGYCEKLKNITIGNSVTSIGGFAFDSTGYYNNASNWENGVLYIENYLIKVNDNISENINIKIKDGTKLICGSAFYDCGDLTGVTIPNTVTSIGSRAFDYCRSLKSITIPDSVTSIGDEAFYSCKELTSIKLPKGITTISNRMFKNCTGLTSLDIPNGVTSIGSDAFYGCNSLNCINYDGTKKEWKAITIDSTNELTNVEINYLREPKTTTTVSGKTFTVMGKNIDGYTVILALYKEDSNGNSQLVECKTAEYSGSEKTFMTTATDYTSAKVMVWKDLETLEPVCEAYEMNFQ